ncbi:hypothetical protein HK102_013524 [Quaeritorhiza haematococci]|nr:hypothetical protein HK102_013524 [Quaeritorhiza haematococci]
MALAPSAAGHRVGPTEAPHVIEAYLDLTCPFSKRFLTNFLNNIYPYIEKSYPNKVQFVFRNQVQPWHPQSAVLHEVTLAVEKIKPSAFIDYVLLIYQNFERFSDEQVYGKSRKQLHEELAELAEQVGVAKSEVLQFFGSSSDGPSVVADFKYHIKLSRQNSIHVSPTVLFDGLIDSSVSSSWGFDEWKPWLEKNIGSPQ